MQYFPKIEQKWTDFRWWPFIIRDWQQRQKIANIVYEPSLKDKTNINEAIKRKVCDAVDIKNDLYITPLKL